MKREDWANSSTSFLTLGLVLSALMLATSVVPLRSAFAGRTVFRDASGDDQAWPSSGAYASQEFRDSLPTAQRASFLTIAHDSSIQWHHLIAGSVFAIVGSVAGYGCATELLRRRRAEAS